MTRSASTDLRSLDHYRDVPAWFAARDDAARREAVETIDHAGVEAFLKDHPEYRPTDFNAGLISAWLELQGGMPMPLTQWNLEVAFDVLRADGLLEIAPPPAAPEVDTSRGVTRELAGLAEYRAPDAERAALAKLGDDPNLSDSARKARDRKLALLAGQQRRAGVRHGNEFVPVKQEED